MTITTDIAIIGAGPSGMFSVFECGMLGYHCALIDSLPEVGGQLTALYPEKPIYDIPGYPSILAGELVEKLSAQIAPFNPHILLGSPITTMEETADGFSLQAGSHTVACKVVIIAGGGGVFTPRKPPLENLAQFEETSVFYAVKNKTQFAGKTLVIAGGGDSAADWAVELAPSARHVHVVHRRLEFRAAEGTVSQLHSLAEQGRITLHTPAQLHGLHGENGVLQQVILADLDGNTTTLAADSLLCFFGLAPNLGPVAEWGLNLDKKKIQVAPATMETGRKGILAVGDIVEYPGKIGLILTGFAEAAIAAKSAQAVIDPDKKFKVVYSTSSGVQGFAQK